MTTTADNQVDAEEIVEEALDAAAPHADPTQAHIDELVAKAQIALKEYAAFNQEQIDYIVAKSAVAALDKHGDLAELAVKETGRGVFEDKAVKNIFACEHVTNSMSELRTVGVISRDELTGITEIAEPVGQSA